MKNDSTTEPRFLALLAACAFPGLGHVVAGEVARGVLVAVGVLGLFLGGMFIGGIDVVDSRDNKVWFIGEALVGPVAFGVDWVHQNRFKGYDPQALRNVTDARQLERLPLRSAYPNEERRMTTIELTDGRNRVKKSVPVMVAVAGATPPNRTSVGKTNELGTLFATIGGMLNLIAVLDAGFPGRPKKAARKTPPKPGLLGAAAAAEVAAETAAASTGGH